jgi:hypothetical protein
VQKRYRGNRGRKVGKAHLKEGRQKIRAAWRLRKQDDKIRETRKYMMREPLGLAPRLKSDSMQEAVLKTLPIVLRPRAIYWIAQNLQDEYVRATSPKKKYHFVVAPTPRSAPN